LHTKSEGDFLFLKGMLYRKFEMLETWLPDSGEILDAVSGFLYRVENYFFERFNLESERCFMQ